MKFFLHLTQHGATVKSNLDIAPQGGFNQFDSTLQWESCNLSFDLAPYWILHPGLCRRRLGGSRVGRRLWRQLWKRGDGREVFSIYCDYADSPWWWSCGFGFVEVVHWCVCTGHKNVECLSILSLGLVNLEIGTLLVVVTTFFWLACLNFLNPEIS